MRAGGARQSPPAGWQPRSCHPNFFARPDPRPTTVLNFEQHGPAAAKLLAHPTKPTILPMIPPPPSREEKKKCNERAAQFELLMVITAKS